MFEIIITIGVVLLLVIIFMLFRIGRIVGIIKGSDKQLVSGSNQVNAVLFLVFLLVFGGLFVWYSYAHFDSYNLPVASEHGVVTDRLFWITTAVTGVVFFITQFLLFTFPLRYQYRDDRKAHFYPDNHKLEIAWTVVPAIVLAGLVTSGLMVWSDITDTAPEDSEVVEIMGHQFAWKVRYPGKDNKMGGFDYRLTMDDNPMGVDFSDQNSFDDFSAGQIYLPVNKNVKFQIRARDVLHSVYLPHFRQKMDAVPGMPTTFWFKPTKTTEQMRQETGNAEFNYELACTEICGNGHFSMRMMVIVVEEAEYNEWKAKQESMIQKDPGLLKYVSQNLQEVAMIKSGLESAPTNTEQDKSEEPDSSM